MNIARRDLILPAFVLGLVGVMPALAASTEEDAVANNVEAFRLAQIAADAKAFDVLCAPELSHSHSDSRVEDKATFIPTPPMGNQSTWRWRIWNRKFVWSAQLQSCGFTGWPKASRSPTARNRRPIFIFS